MGVQNLTIVSPPDGVIEMSTDRLRPQSMARWENNGAGGTTTYRVLHEWDTDSGFGTPISVLNTGIANTVFDDIGIPPSDMGPTGTTWYYQFTVTDDDDAGSLTSAALYDMTFIDPKLAKRRLYAPVNVKPDFSARRINFDGVAYITGDDTNKLTANEAHVYQGIKDWQLHDSTDVTATPQTPPQAPPPFGPFVTSPLAMECITNADAAAPGVKSGSLASTDGFVLAASTQYSATAQLFTELVSKQFRLTLIDYDGGDVEGTSAVGAWVTVPANAWTEITVSGTTAVDAAAGLLRVECQEVDLSNVLSGSTWYQAAHCVRLGAVADFVPSTRLDGNVDILSEVSSPDFSSGALQIVVATRLSNDGFQMRFGAAGELEAAHGDGTGARVGQEPAGWNAFDNQAYILRSFFDKDVNGGEWNIYVDGVLVETDGSLGAGAGSPSNLVIAVGATPGGGNLLTGDVFYVDVYDGDSSAGAPIVAHLPGGAFLDGAIAASATWTNPSTGRVWTVQGAGLTSVGGLDEPALSKRHLYVPVNVGPDFLIGGSDDAIESQRQLYVPLNVTTEVPVPWIDKIEPTVVNQLDALVITGRGFDNAARDWGAVARLYDSPDLSGTFVPLSETGYEDSTVNANNDDVLTVTVPGGASSGWVVVWNDSGAP